MASIIRGQRSRRGQAWPAGTAVGPESAPPPAPRRPPNDSRLFDWLERFAISIERDDICDRWTIHPAHDGMRPAHGTTLRAAATAAMQGTTLRAAATAARHKHQ